MINIFLISIGLLSGATQVTATGTNGAPIRVAILDTGISNINTRHLCATGHKDFTNSGSVLDRHVNKHGSNVAAIIEREAGPGNWCVVILKVFGSPGLDSFKAYLAALEYAEIQAYPILNISLSGTQKDEFESQVIKRMLDKGQVIVVAAGNNYLDLSKNCTAYPACVDSRLIVVSDLGLKSANKYGPVDIYTIGRNIEGAGVSLSGTSQSTAKVTGQIIREVIRKRGF